MKRLKLYSVVLALHFSAFAAAQTVFGIGHQQPAPMPVAPGQVATLYVSGLQVKPAIADHVPLPTSLGGVSVIFQQDAQRRFSAAIFSVSPYSSLSRSDWAAITVQVPFELAPKPSCSGEIPCPLLPGVGQASILINGTLAGQVEVSHQNIHVITLPSPEPRETAIAAFHADGRPVGLLNPARVGEELVLYAFGFGLTTPLVRTATSSPNPPAIVSPPVLDFDFVVSPCPGFDLVPFCTVAGPHGVQATFAGLTPGFVGLYQVHFRVPSETGLFPCQPNLPGYGDLDVSKNLIITIPGQPRFRLPGIRLLSNQVGICVRQ